MKRLLSFFLVCCLLCSALPIRVNAATPTVYYQTDSRWGSYQYGYSNTAGTTPATISSGGCGILAYVNAVYYLNGNFIQPTYLADYSVNNGYRVNGVGTAFGLYSSFANRHGAEYGFQYVEYTTSYSTLQNHLNNGYVAICSIPGHIMACVDYNASNGTYLILDSYPSSNRGTKGTGYVWKTQSQMESMGVRNAFYVLKSIGTSGGSDTNTTTHTVNTAYSSFLPIHAYPISTGDVSVYDASGTVYSNRHITGSSDLCIIREVYTDGWCYVSYPSTVESDGYFEAYVKFSEFTGGTSTSTWTADAKYTAYRRSDLAETLGSVSSGDYCMVVNSSGSLKQVIYPFSGGFKMGWINAASAPTTTDSDFPTPIIGYINSSDTRTTVYESLSTMGTYFGQIFVDDRCTINSVSISGNWLYVTYPVGSSTKNGYVYLDQFFPALGNISKPYSTSVTAQSTSYRKSDMVDYSYGYVSPGDSIIVVGRDGNKYQVIYPVTEGTNAGKYKLAWIYGDHLIRNVTGIAVTTKPSKTVYLEGEEFSTSGMVVTAYYDDGTSAAVSGYSVSGYSSTPGAKTVNISYGGKTTAIDVNVNAKSPTSLSVTTQPSKTSYFTGEDFDTSGMVVKATFNNGTSANVSDYYTSYDFSTAGTKTVTVAYQHNGVTVSTSVAVSVVDPSISAIAVAKTPAKTNYYVGDTLDASGLELIASYNDGSEETVSDGYACSPSILNTAGTQTVTVSYGGKTTTFTVTVSELILNSISVATKPSKTSYAVGDTLDPAGLILTASYSNGTTETITEGFNCSPTTLTTAGTQQITVTYNGKTTSFNVEVIDAPSVGIAVGDICGEPGEQIRVPISLTANEGIIAARLQIHYPSVLTLESVEDGGILGEYLFGNDLSADPYVVMWENGLATSDYTATGVLAYLNFRIASDAEKATYAIEVSFDEEEIYNIDLTNASVTVKNGSAIVGHMEVVDAAVAPTCAASGLTEGKHCSVCNAVLTAQEVVPATGEHLDNNNDNECDTCGTGMQAELTGSIRARTATLNLLDKVCIIYNCTDDLIATNDEDVAERGVLLFDTYEKAVAKDPSQAYETIVLEYDASSGRYAGQSEGIEARYMEKSQFAVAYMKMVDGTCIFGTKNGVDQIVEYSPLIYCNSKKNDAKVGALCRAMMHYGAAAQVAQRGMTEGLMNEGFEAIPYDETVLGQSVFSADTTVTNGLKLRTVTMDLQGAISYIVKFSVEDTALNGKELYAEYSLLGETKSVALELGSDGRYSATIDGVPAKDLGATLKVKAYWVNENGERMYSGELVYSGYEYVRRALNNASYSETIKDLAKALAMYVSYADAYSN